MLERFISQGQMKKFTRLTAVVAAVMVVSVSMSSKAFAGGGPTVLGLGDFVGLDSLVGGASIQVGDKIFSDFSIDGDVLADAVEVVAIQDSNGYGISFQGVFGVAGFGVSDFRLGFAVEVAPDSNQFISDVHLAFDGVVDGVGFAMVVEQVFDGGSIPLGNLLGQIVVNTPPDNLGDTLVLGQPTKKLYIQKDILLVAGGTEGEDHRRLVRGYTYAEITRIDQTFSQIPEPSTVLLVTIGLLGAAATARRRS